jgi:hypothetical protein
MLNECCCQKDFCCDKKKWCKKNCCGDKVICCKKIICCDPIMDDCLAKKIECIWKSAFCDAIILPIVGYPSCAKGVMTLTHSLGECIQKTRINGLESLSILANNAFYSVEVRCGRWLNLYQAIIPDIAGENGCKSSGEVYTEALVKFGISVDGDNDRWKGSCPPMLSINSKAIGMHPIEFSKKQIAAIKAVIDKFICCK